MSTASFNGTAAAPGLKASWTPARPSTFQFPTKTETAMAIETTTFKSILLVEDDPRDAELTLAALDKHHLANKVTVVHDGAQALDYLYCRGKFNRRLGGNPIVVLLDNKMPKVSGLEVLKTVKADENLKMIPVVAMTSSREPADLNDFYKH